VSKAEEKWSDYNGPYLGEMWEEGWWWIWSKYLIDAWT
jgi:hypothetical protein